MGMKFVWQVNRLVDTEIGDLMKRELARRTDPDRIARAVGDLRPGSAFTEAANVAGRRLDTLLAELPRLMVAQTDRRRGSLRHLFDDAARDDPARRRYLQQVEELHRHIERLSDREVRELHLVLERHAQLLYTQVSGTLDDYASLGAETATFNLLLRRLYPRDIKTEEVLDAHHIIEQRFFEKFTSTWHLLGWESPRDMPCIALAKAYHRRSPKRLRSIEDLAREVRGGQGVSSLSQELQQAIRADRMKTPEQLIEAYKRFYAREAHAKDLLDFLDQVLREISRRTYRARRQ